jgi:glucose/mannose-6-phosphate isomerase
MWPEKLSTGLELAQDFWKQFGPRFSKPIKKIAFVGMGGSGIAGRIIKTLLDKKSSVTTLVIDGPELPMSLDAETLAIVVSYSGNTWETLDAFDALMKRFVPTIVLAHGGLALELAELKNLPFVIVPAALSPRASLGYMLGIMLGLFDSLGLLQGTKLVDRWINHAHTYLPKYSQQQHFQNFLNLAVSQEMFHIWGVSGDSAACAYRAQTQFNENAKVQAVFSVIPELCHNLIVGFSDCNKVPLVVMTSTAFLPLHLELAVEAISETLTQKGVHLYKVHVLGDTFEDQLFDIILWADFASYYLGLTKGVDVVSVKIIEQLKQTHKQKGIR